MNKVTIAQIEGRVGGGGSELVASMDMRFGVIGQTIVNQMEVPLGILPVAVVPSGCLDLWVAAGLWKLFLAAKILTPRRPSGGAT